MKNLLPLLLFIYSGTSFSDDWPNSLIQSTYDGCMKSGGSAQCDCLVTRLRERYDFADMRLAMRDKWAKISLKQRKILGLCFYVGLGMV